MKMAERLQAVKRIFLDTAPTIYFVEKNPRYLPLARAVFEQIDAGMLSAVTSPVTLAECLVYPFRMGQREVAQAFEDLIVNGDNTIFTPIDHAMARSAAELRARYNLGLPDAYQVAVALATGCDAVLTNDVMLKRVSEIAMIVLDEVEPD